MKKNLKKFLLIILASCLFLVGCGGNNTNSDKIPDGFTEEEYELSQKIVEIINDYITTDIDEEEALDKLERLGEQLEDSSDITVSNIGTKALLARFEIKEGNYDELKTQRDEIQAMIDGTEQ